MAGRGKKTDGPITIHAPDFQIVRVDIVGTSNYVSNAFSGEAQLMMAQDQEKGAVDKGKKKNRPPKDFEKSYRESMHKSTEGWYGIPCIAFRAAMVRAASLCGVEMTRAKQCVFVMPDGIDEAGRDLTRILKGEPERFDAFVRNSNGSADIRSRGRFAPGWEATVTIRFDAEFLSVASVVNLLHRAGISVGVGAGRPYSTMSVGQGWGTFDIVQRNDKAAE